MPALPTWASRGPTPWISLFALTALALLAGGVFFYDSAYKRIESEELEKVASVGALKSDQIAQWRKERLADARRAASSPFFVAAVEDLRFKRGNAGLRAEWTQRLRLEQEAYDYENVALLDREGHLLISASGRDIARGAGFQHAIEKLKSERSPLHSDLYLSDGGICIDTFAPVVDSGGALIAILMLRSDPSRYLYPLIEFWPSEIPTAETMLITWNAENVQYLSPLRHRPGHSSFFEIPRSKRETVAVKIAEGRRGLVEGLDYRGERVLANTHRVPDTNWMMIAKIDEAELLSEARREAGLVGVFVILGVLLAGSATALGYRRRQARENEIRLSILESAGEGIYGIDTEDRCTFVNSAGARMLGYKPEDLIGQPMHATIHHHHEDGREYPEDACPIIRTVHGHDGARAGDEVFWRRDGSSFAVHYTSHPVVEGKRAIGAVVTFRDVTEQKRSIEALHQSRAELANAQRIARLGSWQLDLEQNLLSWSDEVYRIFGVERGAFSGSYEGFFECVHPDDRESMQEAQDRALRGEADLDIEHRIVRSDGEIRHVHERGELTHGADGRPVRLAGTVQDITERKEAEEALRRQSKLLEIAGEIAKFGGWAVDLPEYRLTWSEEVREIHEAPEGHPPDVNAAIDYYAPDHRDRVRQAVQACIEEGRPFDFEAELITATGRRIWVRSRGVAERNAHGEITRIYGAFQDISDQKRAELDIKLLARRLTTTLESITDAFFTLDRDWRFTYLNSEAERVLEKPRNQLLGRSVWDEFPEAVGSTFDRKYRHAVENSTSVEFEEFYAPLDRMFEVRAYPSEEGLAVYFRDITHRRESERQIQALWERLRAFMDNSPVMITEIDLEGRFRLVNRAVAQLFNIDRDQMLDLKFHDLIPPSAAVAYDRRVQTVCESREPMTVEDSVTSEEGERTFRTTLFPLFDDTGKILSIGSIGLEMTDEIRAKEAIRESETLRLIASKVARLGGWRADLTSGTITSSDEMCDILEIPQGTQRTLDAALNDYAPECRKSVSRAFEAAILDGKPIDVEGQLITAGGKRVWVRTIGHALRNEQGKIEMLQGATQDISARKEEEARLEKLETQLRQAQKMEAVGRLAGGVAHDFNNMLTVIQGYSQMALDDLDESDSLRMNVEEILEAAKRSEELIRQLLAFARQQTIAPRILDLNDTIASMLKMLGRLIGENIELRWQPGADVGFVRMDPVQIDQILANLAVNARDAIDDAGELVIATRVADVDEAYCEAQPGFTPGRYAVLTVSDTGHGMAPETLSQVFEPFYTTKEPGKGTGLGLATVYGILKQNDGHVTAYSEVGQGTTFSIYLPHYDLPDGGSETALETEPLPRGTETLLLVEDEPALLQLTQRLLEELGYTVISAAGVEKAVEVIRGAGDGIDLLITDVIMPKTNGRELWKQLNAIRPGLKVLYMSGYTADVIAHHGVLHEGLIFVQKPFSKQSLATKVREALAQK